MSNELINTMLMGAIAVGFSTGGLFFMRSWRDTKDVLFLCFGIAFFLMAGGRVVLSLLQDEVRTYVYIQRLFAFLLILFAIVWKNLPRPQSHEKDSE